MSALAPEAAAAPCSVLWRDAHLAVVSKPAGLLVHDSAFAGGSGDADVLVDRLRAQFGGTVHAVHRLDRATSGCLLVAFDRDTASRLGRQVMAHAIAREYLAVCRGWPAQTEWAVDHALDGGPGKPQKRPALTHFRLLATCELPFAAGGFCTSRYALLLASPQTGRFRQIRRHLKHASHHLIGDTSHGDGRHNRHFRMLGIHRMLLHALRLAFTHPHTAVRVQVQAGLDADWQRTLGTLPWHWQDAADPDALTAGTPRD